MDMNIDWSDDEEVVRAAIPDIDCCHNEKGDLWLESGTLGVVGGETCSHYGGSFSELWPLARTDERVQVFERAHNPAFQQVAEIETPAQASSEVELTAEQRVRARCRAFRIAAPTPANPLWQLEVSLGGQMGWGLLGEGASEQLMWEDAARNMEAPPAEFTKWREAQLTRKLQEAEDKIAELTREQPAPPVSVQGESAEEPSPREKAFCMALLEYTGDLKFINRMTTLFIEATDERLAKGGYPAQRQSRPSAPAQPTREQGAGEDAAFEAWHDDLYPRPKTGPADSTYLAAELLAQWRDYKEKRLAGWMARAARQSPDTEAQGEIEGLRKRVAELTDAVARVDADKGSYISIEAHNAALAEAQWSKERAEICKRLHIDFDLGVYSSPAEPQPIERETFPEIVEAIANLRDCEAQALVQQLEDALRDVRPTAVLTLGGGAVKIDAALASAAAWKARQANG